MPPGRLNCRLAFSSDLPIFYTPGPNQTLMCRAFSAFFLILMIRMVSYGQVVQSYPAFKNGRLTAENSLLNYKINHPRWQSARFGENYYIVVQMDRIPDPGQITALSAHGIRLEQYISGNNWLAICKPGFTFKNPVSLGIRNLYSIPPSLKINAGLRNHAEDKQGPYDLIAVTCFPMRQN